MVSCSPLEQLTSYAIVVLNFLKQKPTSSEIDRLASVLADGPVDSAVEVFRRCQAADALAAGPRSRLGSAGIALESCRPSAG